MSYTHAHTRVHGKTANIQIRSVTELKALYQYQLPGLDNVLWQRNCHWRELPEGDEGTYVLFLELPGKLKLFLIFLG